MTRLRSLLFVTWFYMVSIPLALGFTLLLLAPRSGMTLALKIWARLVTVGLHYLARIRVEIRGLEHAPTGPALIAAKHQGMFDTIGPFNVLPDACYVLKKELMSVPFYGWEATKAKMIPVDRDAHAKALKDLVRTARERLTEDRQIVIFPEGTRKSPGDPPDYKPGVAALYRDLGLPCTPMATNSGVHWPPHGILRRPGTIVFEFLPAIPAGLKRADFMRELEERIETASNALLAEGL